jgi:hypothetical protein
MGLLVPHQMGMSTAKKVMLSKQHMQRVGSNYHFVFFTVQN